MIILNLEAVDRIYIAPGYADFRKSINGLVALAAKECEADVFARHLFVFFSKNRRKVKMVYWDGSGFWLLYKRLEAERFSWKCTSETTVLTREQLIFLLKGYDISQFKPFDEKTYKFA